MSQVAKAFREEGGFSLVELMVALTVGLIGLLVIGGVLQVSGHQRKVTSSGGDAQTAGAIAAYMIERDVRMSGYGVNIPGLMGCQIHAYDEGVSPARNFTLILGGPLEITAGASGAPDSITVNFGSSEVGLYAPHLTQDNNGTNANYKVDNRFGFHEGDVIVVAQSGVDSDGDGIDDCTLAQVTGVPGTPGQTDNIIHNSGNYTNSLGQNVPARYNKAGGLGIGYTAPDAKIYNLGKLPTSKKYFVDTATRQLMMQDISNGTAATAIGENIVMLRALYGKDTDNDGSADTWDQTTPTTTALWGQVIAVRFAIVARSHQRDAALVSPATLTLWSSMRTAAGVNYAAKTMSLSAEERHYRHKVFETIVPLRNQIWKP